MKKFSILLGVLSALSCKVNAQWTAVNNGLPAPGTSEFEWFATIGTNLFIATGNGVYVTSDNGGSWSSAGLASRDIETLASTGATLFAGTNHGIYKSSNNGVNWTAINSGLDSSNGSHFYSLFVSGANVFAGGEAGVFLSSGSYTSWTAVNTGLMAVDFYAFTQIGSYIFSGGLGVYRTSDNGSHWSEMTSGLPSILNSDFESFAVSGPDVFAGDLSLGVFRSSDNGSTWTAVNSNLPDLNTQALAVYGNSLFAGGIDSGVYVSHDNGGSWSPANAGLTSRRIYSFLVFGNYIFAGTNGGVFRAPLSSFAGISDMQDENAHIDIFPDPSGGEFHIICNMPGKKFIEVYDMSGQCVRQGESCGNEIDVGLQAAGIYILKMSGDNWTLKKKMIKE